MLPVRCLSSERRWSPGRQTQSEREHSFSRRHARKESAPSARISVRSRGSAWPSAAGIASPGRLASARQLLEVSTVFVRREEEEEGELSKWKWQEEGGAAPGGRVLPRTG
ncbi:hypothetical protein Mp_8g12070 [Marchantia polymorpha subsp. ruderalis]|uniref:Uncharacterized protein n=1 Tax=Marchantia polymorpha TaxID=3197 RepID=A0A2R6XM82_MARPO|nr:hypothetical protein MARPO_0008s0009 [Marchantia polymorpha]BBN19610.1 hypothetical protein Mp_8g12070 [Marchantia polymorpha subsp. ruderalis]|eukprot:PTQ47215.1 hypothetical protein MARPO_0008s0009 [Marchantia polymorpha]